MSKKRVVIIGAGISGLALGWQLKKRFQGSLEITILEKSPRPGGWIRTKRCEGFLFEEGPRSCRTKGAGTATLEMIEELALEDQVIAASPDALCRFLFVDGRLQSLPRSLWEFLSSPLMCGVLPALWKEFWALKGNVEDESIYDFVSRRLGPEMAIKFADPLTSGIYAGDIRKLSFHSCFPAVYQLEQDYGSLIRGMLWQKTKGKRSHPSAFVSRMQQTPIISFKDGMETLVKKLAEKLNNYLHLEASVTALKILPKQIEVTMDHGDTIIADHVFMAVPGKQASSLLNRLFSADDESLPDVTGTSVAIVNMGWKSQVLKTKGFGHLIPSSENEKVLGIVFDSAVFPQQNSSLEETRVTVMLGGMLHPEIPHLSKNELVRLAEEACAKQLNIKEVADHIEVQVAHEAIAQYLVGHRSKVVRLEKRLLEKVPQLMLVGSAWYGASVNDCIANAKAIVEKILVFE